MRRRRAERMPRQQRERRQQARRQAVVRRSVRRCIASHPAATAARDRAPQPAPQSAVASWTYVVNRMLAGAHDAAARPPLPALWARRRAAPDYDQESIDAGRAIEAKVGKPAHKTGGQNGAISEGGQPASRAREGMADVGVLLGVSRVIDAINFRIGKVAGLADPRGGHRVGRQRDHPQAVRHVVELLARTAVGAVRRGVPDRRVLDAARQRAHPHRHREQHVLAAHPQHHRRHRARVLPAAADDRHDHHVSYPFVTKSVLLNEQSMNAGGLPQWPAKMLILIGFALLFFQAISELIKRIAVMMGLIPDPYHTAGGLRAAAEAEVARLLAETKLAEEQAKSH